jgi:hypothetical protein
MASTAPSPISHPADNEGPRILAATLTVTALALLAVTARLYVRLGMIRSFGWDVRLSSSALMLAR